MLTFQKQVDNRFARLKNLRTNGRDVTRRNLYKTDAEFSGPAFMQTSYATLQSEFTQKVEHQYAGYVTWVLDNPDSLPLNDSNLQSYARSLALGLNSGTMVDTVWNLLPWSWLINWFSNVDEIVSLTQNSLGSHPENVRLMRHTTSTRTYTSCSDGPITCSSALFFNESKHRWIPSAAISPKARLPVIDTGGLAILVSLLTLKLR